MENQEQMVIIDPAMYFVSCDIDIHNIKNLITDHKFIDYMNNIMKSMVFVKSTSDEVNDNSQLYDGYFKNTINGFDLKRILNDTKRYVYISGKFDPFIKNSDYFSYCRMSDDSFNNLEDNAKYILFVYFDSVVPVKVIKTEDKNNGKSNCNDQSSI